MNQFLKAIIATLSFIPMIAFAQSSGIQAYIVAIGGFINIYVVPAILAIAFLVFLWNAFQYFVVQGTSEEGQKKAKLLALWGVLAFVFIVSIWGLTNAVVNSFNLGSNRIVCPDYFKECN